ncbi:hypothetical protein K466DRAFT_406170 [Polyporus arcularius HHB13444]|uniref:Uncharacterized protein n=1 Tax=Polyporus arcularius HHB13444 TaxID=1314778 RepID=A0A5C3NQQ3_9APHY|nr:hypothetical protein K466DRAFT_406170 [Polyporus arcularius HHB13444]
MSTGPKPRLSASGPSQTGHGASRVPPKQAGPVFANTAQSDSDPPSGCQRTMRLSRPPRDHADLILPPHDVTSISPGPDASLPAVMSCGLLHPSWKGKYASRSCVVLLAKSTRSLIVRFGGHWTVETCYSPPTIYPTPKTRVARYKSQRHVPGSAVDFEPPLLLLAHPLPP